MPGSHTKQYKMAAYQQALQKITEHNPHYQEKLDWIIRKWDVASDSVLHREIGPIGRFPLSLMTAAIIADNKEYFWANYKDDPLYKYLGTAVERACAFGSRQIAESIMEHLKGRFTIPENAFLLGYVCASNNREWMRRLALEMAQAGLDVPDSIYSNFVSYDIKEEIREIFKTGKLPEIPSPPGRISKRSP